MDERKQGPNVVAIGGGHGLSAMLRGLKRYTKNITAIVTVADDGGGSGMLREDLGMLPPGDIRSCVLALANTFGGNLLMIGSVANLIVVKSAQDHGVEISFGEFARYGIPVTAASYAVLLLWIAW